MGCDKSSVGRRLSELLCCPFIDLDSVIEEQTGRSIPEIFATDGEAAFRQMELDVLKSILINSSPSEFGELSAPQTPNLRMVLSLGGGAVMTPECAELVKKNTLCIYLRTSVDTLVKRLSDEAAGRPLLQGAELRDRIETLMVQRTEIYESTAHQIIETDGFTIEKLAEHIEMTLASILK